MSEQEQEYVVTFDLNATTAVRVRVAAGITPEQAILMAAETLDTTLCYQCAGRVDLGDEDPLAVEQDGVEVWARGRREPTGPALTGKQVAVLELAAQGMTAPMMANRLGVEESSVRSHIKAVAVKYGTLSTTASVAAAMRAGWIR